MLVTCIRAGDKYGPEYVLRLQSGVKRHTNEAVNFRCFTDGPPISGVDCEPLPGPEWAQGWWQKVFLFGKPFPQLFIDLDVVVVDDLHPAWGGDKLRSIKDWVMPGCNSSVMFIPTGFGGNVVARFTQRIMRATAGDQNWISHAVGSDIDYFPAHWFPSYKFSDLAPGAKAVIFHGRPKPHWLPDGAPLKELWIGNRKRIEDNGTTP